jgi:hypothetical protein
MIVASRQRCQHDWSRNMSAHVGMHQGRLHRSVRLPVLQGALVCLLCVSGLDVYSAGVPHTPVRSSAAALPARW